MTTRRLLVLFLVAAAATAALARTRRAADGESGVRTFAVTGVVMTPPADGRVTVAHDAIADYMPAMAMPFALGDDAPALAPGDKVRFTLRVAAEWSRADGFEVIGRDPTVAGAAAGVTAAASPRLKRGDSLPPFTLTTEQERPFTAADLRGRLTAITFIFTRCPVPEFCPLMVQRFQQVQREIARDAALPHVQLVSITLDPAFDTPAVLAAYAKAMGARPERWRFVTGDAAEIARLTRAFSVYAAPNGPFIDHTLATAVVDGDGRLVEMWRGNGWSAANVIDVLRRETTRRSAGS